ncbi:hypothetical protein BI364_12985 [Acidihalobacter yilgarnensis]|uniref:Phospholipase/carboxylesterase/thioesterase domain-containing protein n=1 Tax=Acidihalobacter yilgarnensis TaxID=2819280 RepID=A0A1D8IQH3_9GAMM|nr:esterase [Acidihalobacter yilgarnensis]AOU98758.1 hypothetical protein BI364_12985 [Acidihalobacter yilgarnensis]
MPLSESIVIARPEGSPGQLMLLFHGLGATPQDMNPLGERLARAYPRACIVSVRAPDPGDFGFGFQWFSARELSDERRVSRVAAALPAFTDTIRDWQSRTGAGPQETALIGFSQGAIMALECVRAQPALAGRVVSIAGRFARLPEATDEGITWYFLHGKDDAVIHYGYTVTAAEHLVALGGDVVADVLPFVGHEVNDALADLLVERLTHHVPRRTWQEALRDDAPLAPGEPGRGNT